MKTEKKVIRKCETEERNKSKSDEEQKDESKESMLDIITKREQCFS